MTVTVSVTVTVSSTTYSSTTFVVNHYTTLAYTRCRAVAVAVRLMTQCTDKTTQLEWPSSNSDIQVPSASLVANT